MEDTIEVILQDHDRVLSTSKPHPMLSACSGALLAGVYGIWTLFTMPGLTKIPWRLKVFVYKLPVFPTLYSNTC